MNLDEEVIDTGTVEVLETELPDAVDTPAEEKPATMEDTLRAKFRELNAAPTEEKPAAKPAVAAEPVADEQGRVRGVDGKFAAAPVAKAVAAETPAAAAPGAKAVAAEAPAAVDPSIAKAPTSWKGAAQSKWDAVDPEIKAEVHRREADFHKGISQYKGKADTFDVLDAEIRPYEAMIRAAGTNPQMILRDFFNTAYQFKTGTPDAKVETLLNVAKAWNVDLSLLPSVQERMEAGQPIIAPEYRQLEQRFNQLQETVTQRDAREKQEQDAAARAQVEEIANETRAWSAGKEHYEAVKLHMAALIESGQAKDLDDAYTQATWAKPEVRAKLIAQQQEADRKLAVEKAAAAKKASSTNVKPRGTPPSKPTTKVGTMEDTLRAKFKELTGAAA